MKREEAIAMFDDLPLQANERVEVDDDAKEVRLWFVWEDGSRSILDLYRWENPA